MPNTLTDHDLLTIHSGQLKDACRMIGETKQTLNIFIEKIDKRCDDRKDANQIIQDKNMKSSSFWKILTVLVLILMSMAGVMGYNRNISIRNEVKIENLTKITEKNGELLKELLQGLIKDRNDSNLYEKRRGTTGP